ncbi:MAG: PEP/pyruvate-binding domain-containing protein [Brumimicrobium sp.]|nr:PEP/pyruvate-binding domain-containing protein [Brumimicrobium sp.]
MYRYIRSENSSLEEIEKFGGKARNLFLLSSANIAIPRWCVIPSDILENSIGFTEDKLTLDKKILDEIRIFFSSDDEEITFAVRSSALNEDSKNYSYAGIYKSYLNVNFDDLENKILAVRNSLKSKVANSYVRSANTADQNIAGMAVIIQKQINADISGVGFGLNPVNGDEETKVINAVFGIGEGLVSGDLIGDTYKIKDNKINEVSVKKKDFFFVLDKECSGLERAQIPYKLKESQVLDQSRIFQVGELLDKVKEVFGSPQDVEFCYEKDKLHLLQSRPISAIRKNEEYILWDNSNIVESYPGVTTPLTFSFINMVYESVYKQFVRLMGVRDHEIEENNEVFANTLGLVRGRVYYNLRNWYKMLAMAPGFKLNARFMETMMGVKERFDLDDEQRLSKGMARIRVIGMIINILGIHRNLKKERQRFLKHLEKIMTEFEKMNFSELTLDRQVEEYKRFEKSLILEWKAPLINDFFSMVWFGLLKKQSEKYFPESPNIHNNLLCGSRDIISVIPMRESLKISENILKHPEIKALFTSKKPDEILNVLETTDNPDFKHLKHQIDDYLQKFGERCIGELKLETISYTQQPDRFIHLIKNYVEENISLFSGEKDIDAELRKNAEAQVSDFLRFKPLKRWFFNKTLRKSRELVSNRENLRYERTRVFGMVRRMFTAIGQRLHELDVLLHARDIFYLKREEMLELNLNGLSSAKISELREKIATRKTEFDEYSSQHDPRERFYTYGYKFTDEYIYSTEKLEPVKDDLSGIGCCPGIVNAKVRIIRDPDKVDSLKGDILVTSSTDPGWIKLFPGCSGIIVERGSLLSHSAIVSREMGIPCIVAVDGLLRSLKDGDRITMDGSTGKIQIHR